MRQKPELLTLAMVWRGRLRYGLVLLVLGWLALIGLPSQAPLSLEDRRYEPLAYAAHPAARSFLSLALDAPWQTMITLTNLESRQVPVSLAAYGPHGEFLGPLSAVRRLKADETKTFAADKDVPPGSHTLVLATSDRLVASMLVTAADGTQAEVMPALRGAAHQLDFPPIFEGDQDNKTLTLVNVDAAPAVLEAIALDREGQALERTSLELLTPMARHTVAVPDLFTAPTLEQLTTVRVVADRGLVGLQLVHSLNGDLVSLPALTTTSQEWVFPIMTMGGEVTLWTVVRLFNPGDEQSTVAVEAFDAQHVSLGRIAIAPLLPGAISALSTANSGGVLPPHTALLLVTASAPISGYAVIGSLTGTGVTATLGLDTHNTPIAGLDLIGAQDGNVLTASPVVRAHEKTASAIEAGRETGVWRETWLAQPDRATTPRRAAREAPQFTQTLLSQETGLASITQDDATDPGPIFIGTSPPVADSRGLLFLKHDMVHEQVFRWASLDAILGDIETGFLPATTWVLTGSPPSRLVFAGSGAGVSVSGNVLFAPSNRAVVDVVKGAQRRRYMLTVDEELSCPSPPTLDPGEGSWPIVPPPEWTCAPEMYGDGSLCQCDCGARDLDCLSEATAGGMTCPSQCGDGHCDDYEFHTTCSEDCADVPPLTGFPGTLASSRLALVMPRPAFGQSAAAPAQSISIKPAAGVAPAEPAQEGPSWPQWRGPNKDGKSASTGLAPKWGHGDTHGPPLLWQVRVGKGFAAVSVVGDTLYTTGHVGDQVYLVALDLKTKGKLKWRGKLGPIGKGGGNSDYVGARSAPAVGCTVVVALGDMGDLVAFDKATHKEKWRKHYVTDFGGKVPGWDFAESVLLDGDRVIATPGGPEKTMVALKEADGSLLWTGKADGIEQDRAVAGYSSPVVGKVQDKKAYVTLLNFGQMVAFEAEQGTFLAKAETINTQAAVPTCTAVGTLVFCSSGYGGGKGVLWDVAGAQPKVLWAQPKLSDQINSPIKVDDLLFGTGTPAALLYAIDWQTGKMLNQPERTLGQKSASMTYADGKLIVAYANGVVSLWSAEKAPKELSNFVLPGANPKTTQAWSTPVVVDKHLYVRQGEWLYVYNLDPKANDKPKDALPPGQAPPPAPPLNTDFSIAKMTGLQKGAAITGTFKNKLEERTGEGKIVDIDDKRLVWTITFDTPPLKGIFGKEFEIEWFHDGKGTGKFFIFSEVLKRPDKGMKLLGPIGEKDGVIFTDWFVTTDPDQALGEPYAKSTTTMQGKTMRTTIAGGTGIVLEVTPK
jgi:outer membrane protein assembly factor BamB